MKRVRVDTTASGKPVVHGKASSYNNHKCGCDDCTEAWRVYIATRGYVTRYRAKKKIKNKGVKINL